jgi:hypothetical protein
MAQECNFESKEPMNEREAKFKERKGEKGKKLLKINISNDSRFEACTIELFTAVTNFVLQ